MTLSRSAGAVTDASLRIELGGTGNPVATLAPIAPRLLLDGKPLSLTDKRWHVKISSLNRRQRDDRCVLQQVQEGSALAGQWPADHLPAGVESGSVFIDDRQKRVGSETARVGKGRAAAQRTAGAGAARGGERGGAVAAGA